jgi:hypothetical protein
MQFVFSLHPLPIPTLQEGASLAHGNERKTSLFLHRGFGRFAKKVCTAVEAV